MAVTHDGKLVALRAFGRFTFDPASSEATRDTIFDLASVSKVVATTAMAMILYERGLLDLEMPVISIVAEFGGEDPRRDEVTLRMLLAHSSGLPAYERLFLRAQTRQQLLDAAFTTPLAHEPSSHAEYSDIGFIILGVALERLADESLDHFCRREVFGPLGMTHSTFKPAPDLHPAIAPTVDDQTFRHRIVQGEVQDENASVLGGVAGHAGLFSTARDVATFAPHHAASWHAHSPSRDSGPVYKTRGVARRNFARAGMGYAFEALAIRPIFLSRLFRTSRLHRHLPLDRSRTKSIHHAADEPHLARLRQQGDSASTSSLSRHRDRSALPRSEVSVTQVFRDSRQFA